MAISLERLEISKKPVKMLNTLKHKIFIGIIFFITSSMVLFISFEVGLEAVKVQSLYRNMQDNAIYLNIPSQYVVEKLNAKNIDFAKYEYANILENGKNYKVLYMNKKALEYGVPYFEYSYIKIGEVLQEGFYATNGYRELIDNGFCKPIQNLSVPQFNNKITDRKYLEDILICVDDSYVFSKYENIVVEGTEELKRELNVGEGYYVSLDHTTGKEIKSYYAGVYQGSLILVYILCFVPYLFLILFLIHFIALTIQTNARFYKINEIFFYRKKSMIKNLFLEYFICSLLAVMAASFIVEGIFKASFSEYFFITLSSIVVCTFVIFISVLKCTKQFYRKKLDVEVIR